MEANSLSGQIKRLEGEIRRILRTFDIHKLSKQDSETIDQLAQSLTDAHKYALGYELSETREEQLENAVVAKKWLKKAAANVLVASQTDLFSAIDTAHITAQIEQIRAELK